MGVAKDAGGKLFLQWKETQSILHASVQACIHSKVHPLQELRVRCPRPPSERPSQPGGHCNPLGFESHLPPDPIFNGTGQFAEA